MRSFAFLSLATLALVAAPAWAADGKPGEEKTESGLPKVVGGAGVGKVEKGGDKFGKSAPSTPKDERLAKILAGLEPKAPPAKPESAKPPVPAVDPAVAILATFNALDQDGGGFVSWNEYKVLLQQPGANADQLQEIFNHLDSDHNERIYPQEARRGVEYIMRIMGGKGGDDNKKGGNGGGNDGPNPQIVAITQGIFAALDSNGDGKISEREARKDPKATQAFALGDLNQDKELSREEVYNYFLLELKKK